jgi:hypothetical protein
LEILWLQENKCKRSGTLTFYDSCHVSQKRDATSDPMHARHVIDPGGKPRRFRAWHMDFTWIHGPTRASKPPKKMCTLGTDLRTHRTTTQRKHTLSGAHRGSADPTCRPNWPWALNSGAFTWCLPIGPKGYSGGVWLLLTLVLSL